MAGIKGLRALRPPPPGLPPCSSYASGKCLSFILNLTAISQWLPVTYSVGLHVLLKFLPSPYSINTIKLNKSISTIIEASMFILDDFFLGLVGVISCILLMAEAHGERPYWCRL
jgi:hypothetical protein